MVRAGLSRAHVCTAALELADEVGIDHVTMTALARRLGVAVPSLYEHVRGMPDLLDAVGALATDELATLLGEALQGRAGRPALMAYGTAYRGWVVAHPGRYAATVRPLNDADGAAAQARIVSGCAALLRGYGLEEDRAVDAVRFVYSTMHGFTHLETDGGFHHARRLDASWTLVLEAIDRALSTWPVP
ncbi:MULTISPECIES: TetR/AcrR family transcriptional regulator [Dactylosporangium]|uniref:Transcriptional regulator n=2 Tax=Dactylosporangium TaxID=35753 RepID=A0A9W6KQC5_9ACTN|nr:MULTISPECIES: TetR/AcrR family transcriptional regulator [Dactylosporangium]UAB95318.1 WHG domain-containing protein [Dactylosporangium vinaceum]UWZ43645.1 WHG domain-containing protein [Dactylosporangium matsuzakiense]GLL04536.1 transcriptional regulator [Dactylosporangium matsuzakiense]